MEEHVTFSFGQNWLDYLDSAGEEQFEAARMALTRLLQTDTLEGKSFLDIGCGSGIHTLAALHLGARHVTGVDVDPNSVQASTKTRDRFELSNWDIHHGSILDDGFVDSLPQADIVYSWGVLHHTGNMWQAIGNARRLVAPGGRFVIAIYNAHRTSDFWLRFKRAYNRAGPLLQKAMVWSLVLPRIPVRMLKGKHPTADRRGMNIYHDAIDWAGGLPYEFATFEEIVQHCEAHGFNLVYSTRTTSIGCHEFVFDKS